MSVDTTIPAQGSFDALLEEIGTDLSKALPKDPKEGDTAEDDANIKEAAATDEDGEAKDDDEAPGEMKKSFTIKLEDGTEIEAVDGADLVKSLVARVEKNEGAVLKVLGDVTRVITSQADLIKSLRADFAKLADTGKGRKAVVSIAEKPSPAAEEIRKSETEGQMGGDEFMAKALIAQTAGRISGVQVATAESFINAGKSPPRDIIEAVLAS